MKLRCENGLAGVIIALGEGAKIVEPESVVLQMQEEAKRLAYQYSE